MRSRESELQVTFSQLFRDQRTTGRILSFRRFGEDNSISAQPRRAPVRSFVHAHQRQGQEAAAGIGSAATVSVSSCSPPAIGCSNKISSLRSLLRLTVLHCNNIISVAQIYFWCPGRISIR